MKLLTSFLKKLKEKQSTFCDPEPPFYTVDGLLVGGVRYRGGKRPEYDADGDGVYPNRAVCACQGPIVPRDI